MAKRVGSVASGNTLEGTPSAELIEESEKTHDGAVLGYRDAAGVWQFVAPQDESFFRRTEMVLTVYVED